MSGTSSPQGGLTRRSFLKTTGAVAGTAAVGSALAPSLDAIAAEEQSGGNQEIVVQNACRVGCVTGCRLDVYVRDGKVVKTRPADLPDPEYKRACLRGLSHAQMIYSEERVKYPMRRVGGRGNDEWERISWDEAVEEIGDKLLETREKHGAKANYFMSNGGNVSILSGSFGSMRFRNAFEMQSISNGVDLGCMPGISRVYGSNGTWGKIAEPSDIQNADTFFVWGMNLTVTTWDRWRYIANAMDNGAKLVVIDPNFTAIAAKADKFVSVRPASDGALIMGMINAIIEEGHFDRDYVLKATVAPFLVRRDNGKFLRMSDLGVAPTEGPVNARTGKPTIIDPAAVYDEIEQGFVAVNEAVQPALTGNWDAEGVAVDTAFDMLAARAKEFTLERASELSDVSVEDIRELVDLYVNGGTVCNLLGFGSNGYDNGPSMGHAFATLVALTGQIGKSGTNACYHQDPSQGTLVDTMYMFPDGKNLTAPSIPLLDVPELIEKGELHRYGGDFVPPKTLWITQMNAYNNFLNPQTWRDKILPNVEMIVVVDRIMSDTARYLADYVLPAAHFFEQTDVRHVATATPYMMYLDKAAEPLHESLPDKEIYRKFAKKLGFPQYFDMSDDELLKEALTVQGGGVDFDQLKKEKVVRVLDRDYQPYDVDKGRLATASKRFEFYCENPVSQQGLPLPEDLFEENCLPTFTEPREAWPTAEGADKYPFPLISERSRALLHSQYSDVEWLREVEPGPVVFMNPVDAESYSLTNGDYVKVYNDRGYGVVKLVVSDGQRPGSLTWPKGWQQKFYKEGNLHNLTPLEYNPVAVNHSYTDCHVNVEKWEG
ncbi:molybdopterin-dependent oxidoreductase [Eggerthella guodeyinii]|uniref:Molybdopterin-dependent oxidoreductase n=1 Tax=Eggerthella guodeyinii TaxID=2690837 RepID=A0A6L7IT62_9ACTN|nr:molybdopterin-dependent oxidoreductase [Eggerthella guodeyinii]QOS67516.1 molybdopterin-dependent oxidoreductase [Eggerthella guodeyinii]